MHKPLKIKMRKDFLGKKIFKINGSYIKSIQYKSGAIPSNEDGTHDPWDHIESIMGLNIYKILKLQNLHLIGLLIIKTAMEVGMQNIMIKIRSKKTNQLIFPLT